ncbi:glycosyltransferase family 2 protein [Salipiger sp. H15]|uniref:Glycosyltransferase family 2 protein n=1 Tax=Alloyangia sp. H15 TaxID=3029062 RepID=A0AAU8AHX0_9RHOB
MPRASIVVAASDGTALERTLRSLCAQTYPDFEIVVVDDGQAGDSAALAESIGDLRIRVLRQRTRGLAGARNTGIAAARGCFIGFCDAGDSWEPTKLAEHVSHLQARPAVGLSFSGSRTVTATGRRALLWQMPRQRRVGAAEIFRRNPVGAASNAVFRRGALLAMAFRPPQETERDWIFDETFRQCDALELWLRFALVTDWEIAAIPRPLSLCLVNDDASAQSVGKEIAAWERIVAKLSAQDRHFFGRHGKVARAYHLRHLARLAIVAGDAPSAGQLLRAALASSLRPLLEEPRATLSVCAALLVLSLAGSAALDRLSSLRNRSA